MPLYTRLIFGIEFDVVFFENVLFPLNLRSEYVFPHCYVSYYVLDSGEEKFASVVADSVHANLRG